MTHLTRAIAAMALAGVLGVPAAAGADVVTQWNLQVFTIGGPQIQRTLAMVHLAMFDAVNALGPRYTRYLTTLPPAPASASPDAAAAAAAHGVMLRLFPLQQPALAAALAASLATVPDGPDEDAGVAFGDAVAQAMYDSRATDRILVPGPVYVFGTEPGEYQMTTPGPPQPVNTGAASWQPFALESASQFRPTAPPQITSMTYARDVAEVQAFGGTTSAVRTADQEIIARWHTEVGQISLNRILRNEVGQSGDLLGHARIFALLNLAIADAVTSVFEAKYHYRFWRPVTAIRNADLDGNDRTSPDPGWSSFITTPPHPEYPAAHGVVTTSGTRVLEWYFGPNHAFTATSSAVPGLVRSFADFEAFSEDSGMARIYGGMHYRNSVEVGRRQGKKVGNWVIDHYLLPLP